MKITILGGGSYAWIRGLYSELARDEFFDSCELCLMDINKEALEHISSLCLKLSCLTKIKIKITTTTNLKKSLENSDYVIVTVAVGSVKSDMQEHNIARKYGFWNIKGHDIGPAGFGRTIRHVPFMVTVAKLMERECPHAYFLNLANPLIANTSSVPKYSKIKAYGFCHGVKNHLLPLLPFLGIERLDQLSFITAGVDHCSWLLDLKVDGKSGFDILRSKNIIEQAYERKSIIDSDDPFAGREEERLRFVIWDILGYFPAISDLHICEFLPGFFKNEKVRKFWGLEYDRLIARSQTYDSIKNDVMEMISGQKEVQLKSNNEGIADFILAMNGRKSYIDVMNAPNKGQITNLPLDSFVETKCYVDQCGVQPIAAGALPQLVESIVRPVLHHEELYMAAAYEWNKKLASAALSTDPLVNDFINVKDMVNDYFDLAQKDLEDCGIKPRSWQ